MNLAKNRNKKTVVEGVETFEQLKILEKFPDTFIQGYYFSRPLSIDDFDIILREGKPLPVH